MKRPRVALVADWLTTYSGAEHVLESLARIFPKAPIFTPVTHLSSFPKESVLRYRDLHTSFLQGFPRSLRKRHPFLLPWLPRAVESLNLSDYDLIVSSSSFVAKGVLTHPGQLHICYCHSPTRYLWGAWQDYLEQFPIPGLIKHFLPAHFTKLRLWDSMASKRPQHYIANSDFIADGIQKYYRRDAEVLVPPVETERFFSVTEEKEDFYLSLGRLVPQKRVDLLMQAFAEMPDKHLFIAGEGRMKAELQKMAAPYDNIDFLGYLPHEELPSMLAKAKALLHPQLEDAGIAALEALAAGTPVIAYGKGGVQTTLSPRVATFFDHQAPEDVIDAVQRFENKKIRSSVCKKHAKQYDVAVFEKKLKEMVMEKWEEFNQ